MIKNKNLSYFGSFLFFLVVNCVFYKNFTYIFIIFSTFASFLIFSLSVRNDIPKLKFLNFILLNGFLIIPLINQSLNGQSNPDTLYIFFGKLFLANFLFYFSSILILNFYGISNAADIAFKSILMVLIFSSLALIFLFNYKGGSLYGEVFKYLDQYIWHWGRVSGLLGLIFFLFAIKSHEFKIHTNLFFSLLFILFIFYYATLVQSRTLFIYLSLISIPLLKSLFLSNKKNFLILTAAFLPILFYLSDFGVITRILNSFSVTSLSNEGRMQLVSDFFLSFNAINFFGVIESPANITTERLESFHNIFLDSLWYSGYIGFILTFFNIYCLAKRFFLVKSYNFRITILFVILGLIFGAPPFSDFLSLNLLLPFLIFYRPSHRKC